MIKIISSNDKLGTAEVVVITKQQRGKRMVNVSQTKHVVFDTKDRVWRDSKGYVVDVAKAVG